MDKITIKFFAAFREITGQSDLEWSLPASQTVAELWAGLIERYPELKAGSSSALIMVNRRYANRETVVQPGDEVAFLPPVGGGQA